MTSYIFNQIDILNGLRHDYRSNFNFSFNKMNYLRISDEFEC